MPSWGGSWASVWALRRKLELAWYADVPTGVDENARFREAATGVLAARVVDVDADDSDRADDGDSTMVVTG